MSERMLGPYRLMEFRSSGASGDVYLAWDTRFNQRVHVTIVGTLSRGADEEGALYRSFVHAMRGLSSLRHPAVLAPTDFSSPASDEAWYASDQPEGRSLAHLLRTMRRVPWRVVAMLMHEVSAALAFIHGRHLSHGQLTPDNVLVDRTGRIQLADLSVVARVLLEQPGQGQLDLADLYDRLTYLPPESQQRRPPDAESDMFALGVIGYELLSGERPFATVGDVLGYAQARRSAPDPGDVIGDVPLELRRLIQALLSSRRESRPSSAAEVRDGLSAVLREAGVVDIRAVLRAELDRQPGLFGDDRAGKTDEVKAVTDAEARQPERRDTQEVGVPPSGRKRPTRQLGPPQVSGAPRRGRPTDGREPARRVPGTEELASRGVSGGGPQTTVDLLEAETARRGADRPARSASRAAAGLMFVVMGAVAAGGWWLWSETAVGPASQQRDVRSASSVVADDAARPAAEASPAAELEPPDDVEPGRVVVPINAVEEALAKARTMLASERFAEAELFARRGLEDADDVDGAELGLILGRSQAGQARIDDAVSTLLAVDARSSRRGEGHRAAGLLLADSARCADAIGVLREATRRGEDDLDVRLALGRCLMVQGDLEEAESVLVEARALAPDDVDVLLTLARTLTRQTGRAADAVAAFDDVLRVEPANREAAIGLAGLEVGGQDPQTGADRLSELAREAAIEGDDSLLQGSAEALAHAAFRDGRFTEAAAQYAEAARLAGDDASPDLLRNLALALDNAGAPSAARAYVDAIAKAPNDAELRHAYGRLMARLGDWTRAAQALEGAARLDPTRAGALFDLGTSRLGAGDPTGAAAAYRVFLRLRPGDHAALQNLGKAEIESGDTAAAIETFGQLTRLRPDDPQPVLTVAVLMQRMERSEEAAPLFERACQLGAQEACK